MVLEISMSSIYSAPYGLSSTCFGRQIPESPVVNLPSEFCDDRPKGVGVMAIISKHRPLQKYTGLWRPCFDRVDRVNLSKVLFILLFLTLCKLTKNL